MAIRYSKEQFKFALKNTYNIPEFLFKENIFCKILKRFFIFFFDIFQYFTNKQKLSKKFLRRKIKFYKSKNLSNNITCKNLEEKSSFFLDNNWCFLDDFLDTKTHTSLVAEWPHDEFFIRHKNTAIKFYEVGFKYRQAFSLDLIEANLNKQYSLFKEDLNDNPVIEKIYDFILSDFMKSSINKLTKTDLKYENLSILTSIAQPKSYLIPHIDSISEDKASKNKVLNCIYFVDGNNDDPEHSGATSIFKDNNFQSAIFQTKNIVNSLLIYNSTSQFYHGFKRINKLGHRKAITFQFIIKDQYKETFSNKNKS